MKVINGEQRYTKDEARARIAGMVREWGPNESINDNGMSYRRNGVPGVGGGTIAISYGLPIHRKGVAYYKELGHAS